MFAKRLQMVDEYGDEGVDEDDDDHAGAGWNPPEAIPAAFPPFDLLAVACSLSVYVFFVLCWRRLEETLELMCTSLFLGQTKFVGSNLGKSDRRGRKGKPSCFSVVASSIDNVSLFLWLLRMSFVLKSLVCFFVFPLSSLI
jgi:hypothetical protein